MMVVTVMVMMMVAVNAKALGIGFTALRECAGGRGQGETRCDE